MRDEFFDPSELVAEARRRTQLEEFDDLPFAEPLAVLAGSLEQEADLNVFGRQMWRERIINFLMGRLRAHNWFRRHPEILEEVIAPPVIILGLARTGSTLLHRLLASDCRFHSVAWWEARYPVPADDDLRGEQRIAVAKAEVAAILDANPGLAAIHPWDALGADEDNHLLDHTLMSTSHEALACIPSYHAWIAEQDLRKAYGYWFKMLQLVQWQKRRRGMPEASRWVLKTPVHLGYVDVLAEMFPEARYLQTHRDPLATVPSYASMVHSLWVGVANHADPHQAGQQTSATLERNLKRCLRARDALPAGRFFDVDYRQTVTHPIELIERIYSHLEMPFTPAARQGIEAYLRANPRERRPPHAYTLAQFGFTEQEIAHRFREYRERHVLPNN